jgi:hypothetical protein
MESGETLALRDVPNNIKPMNNNGGLMTIGIIVLICGIAMIGLGRPVVGCVFLVTGSIRIIMALTRNS